MNDTTTMRPAVPEDVEGIQHLLNMRQADGFLLPVSDGELTENISDFMVIDDAMEIVGVGRLKTFSDSLGEVRTLMIAPRYRHRELGRHLVQALLHKARQSSLAHVFVLTDHLEFFERLGFREVARELLPLKIWADCRFCYKREACDEKALWLSL